MSNNEIILNNNYESILSKNSLSRNDIEYNMENFIFDTDKDIILDKTDENLNKNKVFIAKNTRDYFNNIYQSKNTEILSIHIIFNQVGSHTIRKRHIISRIIR